MKTEADGGGSEEVYVSPHAPTATEDHGSGDGGGEEKDKVRAENDGDDKMIHEVVSNAGIKFFLSHYIY
jgi:hypothetical protein